MAGRLLPPGKNPPTLVSMAGAHTSPGVAFQSPPMTHGARPRAAICEKTSPHRADCLWARSGEPCGQPYMLTMCKWVPPASTDIWLHLPRLQCGPGSSGHTFLLGRRLLTRVASPPEAAPALLSRTASTQYPPKDFCLALLLAARPSLGREIPVSCRR